MSQSSTTLAIAADSIGGEITWRRIAMRIMPVCLLAYIVSFVDRSNIGIARLQFMQDLRFDEAIYGLGAGLFFIGYTIFEVPVNLLIERRGARVTLAAIMVVWGLISSSLALVRSPIEFYVVRFALGLAEAGLFPGIVLYLSYWFPAHRRGRMMAVFAMGGPIAGVLGAPLGAWIMSSTVTLGGWRGWQNLFILEGIPAILLGVFVLFYLDDRPGHVRWLTPEQNRYVVDTLSDDDRVAQVRTGFYASLRDRRLYVCFLSWIGVIAGVTVVTLWTPTLIKQTSDITLDVTGWLSAIPALSAAIAMHLVARHSDRSQERRWHFAACIAVAALSLIVLTVAAPSIWTTVLLLSVASAGLWAATPVFWTIPGTFLRSGTAAAGGIALISSLGGLGGFFGPVVLGWTAKLTGSYTTGIAAVAMFLLVIALLFATLMTPPPSGHPDLR
jgi:MFS family permease